MITIPKIANITDIRYSWSKLLSEIEREQQPLLVLDRSRPQAVILPLDLAKQILVFPAKPKKSRSFSFRSADFGKIKIPLTREYIYE